MKQLILNIACVLLLLNVVGCGQRDKSKILEQYKYDVDTSDSTVSHKKKPVPWLKEGTTCYGIVMVRNENKTPTRIKEVYAKVISIRPENIKMEALEDVYINRLVECNYISLKKGECWDEAEGELFKTREEAIQFIDSKYPGLRMKH